MLKMNEASTSWHEIGLLVQGQGKPGQNRECGSHSYSDSTCFEGG